MGKKSKRIQKDSSSKAEDTAEVDFTVTAPQDPTPVEDLGPLLSSDEIGNSFDETVAGLSDKEHDEIIAKLRAMHIKAVLNEQKLKTSLNESNHDRNKLRETNALMGSKMNKLNGEKGILLTEHGKLESANSKLQELCRQLQKENKRTTENSKQLISEELEKRKELSNGFSSSIEGISEKLEEQAKSSRAQIEENDRLRNTLKDLLEKFDMQQAYFDNSLKTKDLEAKLLEAKLAQQEAINNNEKEKYNALLQHGAAQEQTVEELKKQIALYSGKFETFSSAIESSNQHFKEYKTQLAEYRSKLEEVTKSKIKADRENINLKEKIKSNDIKLTKLMNNEKELTTLRAAKVKLEKLCRSLAKEKSDSGAIAPQNDENSVNLENNQMNTSKASE